MRYDLYRDMEKQRGEYAEYGNTELSYNYLVKQVQRQERDNIKMLDIGTNIGTLPWLIYSKEKMLMDGVEVRESAVEKGKKKYPEIADRLHCIGPNLNMISDEFYDVVTMFDVIEHIPDIENYLKDVYRIIRPGGIFVFQTPNARINPLFEIVRTKSLTAYKDYHCSLQTPNSLRRILKNRRFIYRILSRRKGKDERSGGSGSGNGLLQSSVCTIHCWLLAFIGVYWDRYLELCNISGNSRCFGNIYFYFRVLSWKEKSGKH